MGAIENVRAIRGFDPDERYGIVTDGSMKSREHPMDSETNKKLHGRLLSAWHFERRRQSANRYQMALDWDYYDGIQLTEEDVQLLENRGQSPLVFNLVKRTVDWIIGTERRTRVDFRVVGREEDDAKVAEIKTKYLKYLADTNKTHFHRSHAFKEAAICGLSWLEDGARNDPGKEPIYSRAETWRNILHDSLAVEWDLSDARYVFRQKWVDVDVAQAIWPDRKNVLTGTEKVGDIEDDIVGEWYLGNRIAGEDYRAGKVGKYAPWGEPGLTDATRSRVRLIEAWFRQPVREQIIKGGAFHDSVLDPKNPDMAVEVMRGDATVVNRIKMQLFVAIMTESHILDVLQSPYKHDRFPFTPVWCYRRGRDNLPYGIVRNLRDPQDDFNRRMSKALFALSAYRIKATADAIDPKIMDWDELREEAGRPDALLVYKRGAVLEVESDRQLGEAHLGLADRDSAHILDASGVTRDNLGLQSNAKSGIAIQAKQQEGAAVTTEIFDNLRLAVQSQGEIQLALTEQFATEEKVFRITNARGVSDYVRMNVPEEQPDGTVIFKDDITASQADFIVDQQDFNTSLRDAASQQLMELAGRLQVDPMVALNILDMAISVSNIPQKDELVRRIRMVTGYTDPEEQMSDQERAEMEQKKQQAEQQQKMQAEAQQQAFMAELEHKKAQVEKTRADAIRVAADAEKIKKETALMGLEGTGAEGVDAAAQQALAQANEQVAALEQQIAMLKGDKEAQYNAEIRKAQLDKEAQIAVALINKQEPDIGAARKAAESSSKNANDVAKLAEKAASMSEQGINDLMQLVHSVAMDVEGLQKRLDEEAEEDAKEPPIEEVVTKAVERAVSAIPEPKELDEERLLKTVEKKVDEAVKKVAAVKKATDKEITLPDGRKVIVKAINQEEKK